MGTLGGITGDGEGEEHNRAGQSFNLCLRGDCSQGLKALQSTRLMSSPEDNLAWLDAGSCLTF